MDNDTFGKGYSSSAVTTHRIQRRPSSGNNANSIVRQGPTLSVDGPEVFSFVNRAYTGTIDEQSSTLCKRPKDMCAICVLSSDEIESARSDDENERSQQDNANFSENVIPTPLQDNALGKNKDSAESSTKRQNVANPWTLVVIISVFFIKMFTFSIAACIGLYNVEFMVYFDTSAAAVSAIGSINLGIFSGAGPIISIMVARFGHRAVVMTGGVLSTVGLLAMLFANNIETLYVSYGLFTGLGFCMSTVPALVLTGLYTEKYLSLASGFVASGGGLGTTVLPPVINYLIDEYSWKGSMLVLACLTFQIVFLGALLRPPPQDEKLNPSHADTTGANTARIKTKENELNEYSKQVADGSLEDEVSCLHDKARESSTQRPKTRNRLEEANECRSWDRNNSPRFGYFSFLLQEHFSVFKNLVFVIYFVSTICWSYSYSVFLTFAPDFFITNGLTKFDAAILLTLSSAGDIVGSLLGGILGNIQSFSSSQIYIVANIICSISFLLYNVIGSFVGYAIDTVVLGFAAAVLFSLTVKLTTDIIGKQLMSVGVGYIVFALGIGSLGGPPIAGYVLDVFHDYKIVFYKSAAVVGTGGLIMLLIPVYERHIRKKTSVWQESE